MKTYTLWIDHDHAKLFPVFPGAPERQQFSRKENLHHTHADPAKHKNEHAFFHEVAEALRGASELLVLGPGQAKDHFVAYLERHIHNGLKVVGVEATEHLSDSGILERSRAFFKVHDVFEHPIS